MTRCFVAVFKLAKVRKCLLALIGICSSSNLVRQTMRHSTSSFSPRAVYILVCVHATQINYSYTAGYMLELLEMTRSRAEPRQRPRWPRAPPHQARLRDLPRSCSCSSVWSLRRFGWSSGPLRLGYPSPSPRSRKHPSRLVRRDRT